MENGILEMENGITEMEIGETGMAIGYYPLFVPAAFMIDNDVAGMILLEQERKEGTLPKKLKKIIDKAGIYKAVMEKLIPDDILEDYCDTQYVMEILDNAELDAQWIADFTGTCKTLWPDLCGGDQINGQNEDGFLTYIETSKRPDFFQAAYGSREELADEFRKELCGLLPEDLPFYKYIVSISGTYAVY